MPRPSQPLVSREAAGRAALAVIDAEGLAALTTRRLAAALGVSSAALYHHFKTKDDILDEVARQVLHHVRPPDPAAHWTAQVAQQARSYRQALLGHPAVAPLMLRRRYRAFAASYLTAVARAMADDGVPGGLIPAILESLEAFAYGAAATAAVDTETPLPAELPGLDDRPDLAERLRAPIDKRQVFEDGLAALIDGWRRRIELA